MLYISEVNFLFLNHISCLKKIIIWFLFKKIKKILCVYV